MIDLALISSIILLVIAFVICRALLIRDNHSYISIPLAIGFMLVLLGLSDPNLHGFSDFLEMTRYKRSRAVFPGIGCILGTACYWLFHKSK